MNNRNRMTTKVPNPCPRSRQQGQEYAQKIIGTLIMYLFSN